MDNTTDTPIGGPEPKLELSPIKINNDKMEPPQSKNSIMDPKEPSSFQASNSILRLRSYINEIPSKITKLKQSLNQKLKEHNSIMHTKYSQYKLEIQNYLSTEESRISQKYKEDLNNQKIRSDVSLIQFKIDSILKMQEIIQDSITENLLLIDKLFTSTKDILTLNSPIEIFITRNMESFKNSLSLVKINSYFSNSESTSGNNISNIIKEAKIISFNNHDKNFNVEINAKSEINDEIVSNTFNNMKRLSEINLNNVGNDEYFKLIPKKNRTGATPKNEQYDEVCKITLTKGNYDAVSFYDYFPNVEVINIKNAFINSEIIINGKNTLNKLKELHLVKLNLTTHSFENIIKCLYNNSDLLDNLEILSVKHNKISKPNIIKDDQETNGEEFKSLCELDFTDNIIFKYDSSNFNCTPKLRMINLSNNSICISENFNIIQKGFRHMEKYKKEKLQNEYRPQKHIIQAAKNSFINKGKQRNEYIKYTHDILCDIDYPIKTLNFDSIFNSQNYTMLTSFKLSETIMLNLQSLNLSMCSLKNETIIQFLINCKGLFKLRKLFLSYNLINDNFFEMYLNKNVMNVIPKIEIFDLSGNTNINISSVYGKFLDFLNAHKTLKEVRMEKTSFEVRICNYIKSKINEMNQAYSNDQKNQNCLYSNTELFNVMYKDKGVKCKIVFREITDAKTIEDIIEFNGGINLLDIYEFRPFDYKNNFC